MLSEKQCELARLFTQDIALDIQINSEYAVLPEEIKTIAAQAVIENFKTVASHYNISPATLFCVYMEIKGRDIL